MGGWGGDRIGLVMAFATTPSFGRVLLQACERATCAGGPREHFFCLHVALFSYESLEEKRVSKAVSLPADCRSPASSFTRSERRRRCRRRCCRLRLHSGHRRRGLLIEDDNDDNDDDGIGADDGARDGRRGLCFDSLRRRRPSVRVVPVAGQARGDAAARAVRGRGAARRPRVSVRVLGRAGGGGDGDVQGWKVTPRGSRHRASFRRSSRGRGSSRWGSRESGSGGGGGGATRRPRRRDDRGRR